MPRVASLRQEQGGHGAWAASTGGLRILICGTRGVCEGNVVELNNGHVCLESW